MTANGTVDVMAKENQCPIHLRINALQADRKRRVPLEGLENAAGKKPGTKPKAKKTGTRKYTKRKEKADA